jgi:hypothetical protein
VNLLSLALLALGIAAVCYGCWLVLPAAGFIVGGVLVLAAGLAVLSVDETAKT